MRIAIVCLAAVLLFCYPAQASDGVPYLNAAWLEELPGDGFGYRCLIRVNEVTSKRLSLAVQFKLPEKDGENVRERGSENALLLWPEMWVKPSASYSGHWRPEPVPLTAEFFKERADLPPGSHRIEVVFDIWDPGLDRYVESGHGRHATFTYTLSEDGTAALVNEGTVPTVLPIPADLGREEASPTLRSYGLKPVRVLGTLGFRAGRSAFDGTPAFGGGGILTAYPGGKIRLWDETTGALERETAGSPVRYGHHVSLILSRDGLHDVKSGKLIMGLEGGAPPALAARLTAGGAQLCVLGRESFTVWRVDDGKKVREVRLRRPDGEAQAGPASITPCGRFAAIVKADVKQSRIDIFDTATGRRVLATPAVHDATAMLAVTKDGKTVAAPHGDLPGDDGAALFDAESGEIKTLLSGAQEVRALALSPDGRLLAIGGAGLGLHEMATGKLVRRLDVPGAVTGLSFGLGGDLLCASTDRGARTFDVKSGRELARASLAGPTALSPDGSKAVTVPWWGDLVVWDTRTGESLNHCPRYERMEFSADGTRVAAREASGTIRVWDVATGRGVFAMKADKGPMRFGPGGKRLAAGYCHQAPVLWDVDAGSILYAPRDHGKNNGYDVAFSPDGRHVGVAWGDKWVQIYNYLRHEYVTKAQLETHARCLVFSPDGKRLGMEAQYGLVQVDVAVEAPFRQTLKAKSTEWLAYSPDGKRVAIGGEPPAIYDVGTGKRLVALGLERIYRPRFVFSPDGRHVLATRDEEWIAVFDAADGRLLRTMKGDLRLNAAAFSPDGKHLHTAVGNGAIVTWEWE